MPKFSPTTIVEKSAFNICFMKAMDKYFSYEAMTFCGFPSITLEGTTHDWEDILKRTKQLSNII
ncbi:MAG: DUF4419 domain-containing protein [Lentisphaerae bacterium]|nr:DUF4419 domain-containing protein [Lentisphaerota bacterium]MCP4103004.1 DUF4419 domain-containing protein [Lentisphaerota bacterium]